LSAEFIKQKAFPVLQFLTHVDSVIKALFNPCSLVEEGGGGGSNVSSREVPGKFPTFVDMG
jgi:hypothetical protein